MLVVVAVLWMAVLSGYDIRERRLPNWLTLPGFAVIWSAEAAAGHGRVALVGAAVLATAYLAVHMVVPSAMGAGDVKLALGLGALTGSFGAGAWVVAAIGAPVLTVVAGTLARLVWSVRTVPHGPSMCVASAVAMALAAR